jgi:acyl-CoA reductase-like NAD-dependent aldehyde dehydrogenase
MTAAVEMMSSAAKSERATDTRALDAAVQQVKGAATTFARLPIPEKIALLKETLHRVAEGAEAWALDGHKAKGLSPDHGEEWLAGVTPTMRNLRLLAGTLSRIQAGGRAVSDSQIKQRPDGRVEVNVFPTDGIDGALFAGFTVSELMQEGLTPADVKAKAGSFYDQAAPEGGVSLILGAGNVSSIPPMDALYKSFAEGYVNVVKMNPVNEWAGPHLERAFKPFIDRGFLRVVYGGADVGKYLVEHPLVDDIHITGSNLTHDMIVWGPPGPERERRIREKDPLLKKRITSELGNVSPVAIVPGQYDEDELQFMAKNVAAMVTNNASFNCNAAKMLVVAKGWSQRTRFMELVVENLSTAPTRLAYYPGAFERYGRLVEGRSGVRKVGTGDAKKLPWTVITDVDPSDERDPVFSTEPFCGLISETALDASEPAEFLAKATVFMNDTLWGTLNAMIVISPKHEKSQEVSAALDTAVKALRYGSVTINHWAALVYATTSPAWGGHPSATLEDVQSGIGWVHNTYLLEGIEKTVLRGPLKVFPKPVWFADHRRVEQMGRRLVQMELSPSWLKVPGLVVNALQG